MTTSHAELEAAVYDDGFEYQGIIGYVYNEAPSTCAGTVPFYRTFNAQLTDHYYVTNATSAANAAKNGYTDEGIAAYVFPPS